MSETMIKTAVRSIDGKAKPLRIDLKERVITQEESVAANANLSVNIDTAKPYRIFVFKHDNPEQKWSARKRSRIGGLLIPSSGFETVLESDGVGVVRGNGSRSSAYTDVIVPEGSQMAFQVINNSNVATKFSIVLVEYPVGFEGGKARNNRPLGDNPISISKSGALELGSTTIYESSKPTRLDLLEFSTNVPNSPQLYIHAKTGTNTEVPVGSIRKDGANTIGVTPGLIVEHGISLYDIKNYENGAYKFAINQPLNFPRGVRISVSASVEGNFALRAYGVEYND